MKRFVVAVTEAKDSQATALQNWCSSVGAGWWHHLPNVWLISTGDHQMNAKVLRSKVIELCGAQMTLVLELPEGYVDWSGWGYEGVGANPGTFDWLEGQSWNGTGRKIGKS